MEIGGRSCATVRQVAGLGGPVCAVEVSKDIIPGDLPSNVTVAISDGVSIPVARESARTSSTATSSWSTCTRLTR